MTNGGTRAGVVVVFLACTVWILPGCRSDRHEDIGRAGASDAVQEPHQSSAAQQPRDRAPQRPIVPLLATALDSFKVVNSNIDSVSLIESRLLYHGRRDAVVLVYGLQTVDPTPMEDEVFGVFRTNAAGDSATNVVRIFPTERWKDFDVRFEHIARDSIVLHWQTSYDFGEMPPISWHAPGIVEYARPQGPWLGAVVDVRRGARVFYAGIRGRQVNVPLEFEGSPDYEIVVLEDHNDWFKVVVSVPSEPCGPDLRVKRDTVWLRFKADDGTQLLKRVAGTVC